MSRLESQPTTPGYYWFREGKSEWFIAHFWMDKSPEQQGLMIGLPGMDSGTPVSDVGIYQPPGSLWYGPLEPPDIQ